MRNNVLISQINSQKSIQKVSSPHESYTMQLMLIMANTDYLSVHHSTKRNRVNIQTRKRFFKRYAQTSGHTVRYPNCGLLLLRVFTLVSFYLRGCFESCSIDSKRYTRCILGLNFSKSGTNAAPLSSKYCLPIF